MASENKWEKPTKNTLKLIIEIIEIVIIAFALSWVLRTFVLEARVVPTGSMIPTIQLQDRILVDKFFYKFGDFERGDIVVFQPPPNAHTEEDYIKRIIAL
ncbi:MAG: signal peptidase I, partial [Desulfitobacterium sp.]|nr:signal peptidase I [Desulfitobacterium sp.]